jgi:hypothetical protein
MSDETTRPLTNRLPKELLDDWRKAAIRSIPLSSATVLALLDALDAREAQTPTCQACAFWNREPAPSGVQYGRCDSGEVEQMTDGQLWPHHTFGCNQWAAKEPK